jgi:ribonuclease Z
MDCTVDCTVGTIGVGTNGVGTTNPSDDADTLSRLGMGNVRVDHCPHAFGLIMQHAEDGWKLVYSGDTKPCNR